MGPSTGAPRRGLTVVDILDQRAYERVRDDYRRRVIELKRRRRVALGPIMTLVFESFDTVRFQVQEMARVERITTDAGIQGELNVYNRLLPEPGELSATLFIELMTDEELHDWLPRLVGIETALAFEVPSGGDGVLLVRSAPEATHAEQLTRATETSAVHYIRFPFSTREVAGFAAGPVSLLADHPAYQHRTELTEATRAELLGDLEGRTERLSFG
jgi:hypothetical protein